MRLDFVNMEAERIPHMRGGEKEVALKSYSDGKNKIMLGRLIPGATIGLHTHETNSETVYILSGTGKMLCDGVYEDLAPGVCTYCPKGHQHSLMNDNPEGSDDLVFFAVVPEQ